MNDNNNEYTIVHVEPTKRDRDKKETASQKRSRIIALKEDLLDKDFEERSEANERKMSLIRPGSTVGYLKAPGVKAIKVDVREERLICRCGQSEHYPYCDMTCKEWNETRGTSFEPWKVSIDSVGKDTVFVCGCGESDNFKNGEPTCDGTCESLQVNLEIAELTGNKEGKVIL